MHCCGVIFCQSVNIIAPRSKARRDEIEGRFNQLTLPEREVLELIVSGNSNKATALELEVSLRTVEDRRRSIMRKLKAGSFAELIKLAVEEHLSVAPLHKFPVSPLHKSPVSFMV